VQINKSQSNTNPPENSFQFTNEQRDPNTCNEALKCLSLISNRRDFIPILDTDEYKQLLKDFPIDLGTCIDKEKLSQNLVSIMEKLFADDGVKQLVDKAYKKEESRVLGLEFMMGIFYKMTRFACISASLVTMFLTSNKSFDIDLRMFVVLYMSYITAWLALLLVCTISLQMVCEGNARQLKQANNFLSKNCFFPPQQLESKPASEEEHNPSLFLSNA